MIRLLAALFSICAVFVASPQAQASIAPLIASFNGQVYRLEGEALVPYDACTPDEQITGNFIATPDGTQFVMFTLPPVMQEALATLGSLGGGPLPANLWLCDTRSDTLTRIFAAEGGDAAFEGEFPDVDAIIGPPRWSPSGDRLVWAQLDLPDSVIVLIYDVASGTTERIMTDITVDPEFPAPPTMTWRDANTLLYTIAQINDETFAVEELVNTFSLAAQATTNTALFDAGGEFDDFIVDRVPLQQADGTTSFALRYFEQGWSALDSETGQTQTIANPPERFSPTAPDGETLLLRIDEDFSFNWERPTGGLTLTAYLPNRVAIAPDGQTIAYADSVLRLWRDGTITEVANSDGFADDAGAVLLWGGTAYRVGSPVQLAAPEPVTCEGTLPSRLVVGEAARVVAATVPNNVRAEPLIGAPIVGQIPGGGTTTILDGPVCATGYAWYQVQVGTTLGWTAEALPGSYLLEPAQ